MEQQNSENIGQSLSQGIDNIQIQASQVPLETNSDNQQIPLSEVQQAKLEEVKQHEEQKEGDKQLSEDSQEIKKELTKEQQQKKFERIQQCILALVAVKKMKTDHQPAKIMDYLYLGSIGAALKKEVIENLNIKFILSAMDKSKPMFQDICTYKQLPILDSPDVDIQKYFDESSEFIHQAVSSQQNILVHWYLMKYQKLSLNDALNLVRQTREIAQPNQGFMKQLATYEQNLKNQIQSQNEDSNI